MQNRSFLLGLFEIERAWQHLNFLRRDFSGLFHKGTGPTFIRYRMMNASVDPAGSGENAVKYLGNYVQRSVISDQRILIIEGDKVRITVKNRFTGKSGLQ